MTLNVEELLLLIHRDFHITNTSRVYRGWSQKGGNIQRASVVLGKMPFDVRSWRKMKN